MKNKKEINELNNDECIKEFTSLFNLLCTRHNRYETWCNLVYMWSDMLSFMFDDNQSKERKDDYLKLLEQYDDAEKDIISNMLKVLGQAYTVKPNQDFLGDFYMHNKIHDTSKGQFFTPYHISELMAAMTYNKDETESEIKRKGFISCVDSCCGSGVMLLAYANEMIKQGIKNRKNILLIGQDLSEIAARMCYIQMSINGLLGIIKIDDSLLHPLTDEDIVNPGTNIWRTPLMFAN